jgi:hypothetical protein
MTFIGRNRNLENTRISERDNKVCESCDRHLTQSIFAISVYYHTIAFV